MKSFGFICIFACVLGGFSIEDGLFSVLFQPTELLIILGAAIGYLVISNPPYVLKNLGIYLYRSLIRSAYSKSSYLDLQLLLYKLFQLVRKQGVLRLEDHIEDPERSSIFREHPWILKDQVLCNYICDSFRIMLQNQIASGDLNAKLQDEMETIEMDLYRYPLALHKIADALPGFGILAAVMGIILAMGHINGDITTIGLSVASALSGTFIGILFSYGFFAPLANLVQEESNRDMMALGVVKGSILAYQSKVPTVLVVDAGRRNLFGEMKPSFNEMNRLFKREARAA
ncbi:flagellar motor stator protein MotA [Dongshaea marina]|uniref:flagellar motor stator protein MotA n=1 Tax=Dongshaea marina TaxID=2047966 RepID=UPI001F40EF3A|nr:flagellar motor stator protein MotA [Dongshaea marina]